MLAIEKWKESYKKIRGKMVQEGEGTKIRNLPLYYTSALTIIMIIKHISDAPMHTVMSVGIVAPFPFVATKAAREVNIK